MKKGILSIAVIAASLFSFSAIAQTPAKSADCCNTTAQCANPQTCPKDAKLCAKNAKACPALRPCAADPFEGINLTDAQKAKLATLKEQRKAKCEAAGKAKKERFQQRDSMVKANKKEYLNGVKEVLTPEQYVVFLENIVVSAPGNDRAAHHNMRAVKKGDFKKGDRRVDMKRPMPKAEK